MLDPYGVLLEGERTSREIGPYKMFIHFTRSSMNMSCITLCAPAIGRLRQVQLKAYTALRADINFSSR